MSKVVAVLALILGVALTLFGVQNDERVSLHFLWLTAHALPVSLAILVAALLGFLVGALVMLPGRIATGRAAGQLRRDATRRDAQATALPVSTPTSIIEDVPVERTRL